MGLLQEVVGFQHLFIVLKISLYKGEILMSDILKGLQPRKVFEYFEAISEIPRGSGNEKAISDYMVKFATDLGLEVKQDNAYNVYIKKPATPGYEHVPTVILQGHLDMVCEKNKDTVHDFEKDGLKLYIDGDWIGAKGTTLGADNGVAIAYQMAVLADQTLKHPTIECLMTTDEERGMTGVANLHPEFISGKILLNLDTDVEGEFLLSCAGGAKAYFSFPIQRESISQKVTFYRLVINGLKGGHSGADIHFERANAHILMGRMLYGLSKEIEFKLVEILGGSKDNVITRECEVILAIHKDQEGHLGKVAQEIITIFQKEYSAQEEHLCLTLEEVPRYYQETLTKGCQQKLIDVLMALPNGVMGYDQHMKGLVQTSLNLGILQMHKDYIELGSAVRSSVASRKMELLDKLEVLSKVFNLGYEVKGDYPAWQYNENSRIRECARNLYKELYNKEPVMTAIHAGLECGFISEKCPGLDMISFGPNVKHIHSPQEVVSISSMARVYEYLIKLLENLVAY